MKQNVPNELCRQKLVTRHRVHASKISIACGELRLQRLTLVTAVQRSFYSRPLHAVVETTQAHRPHTHTRTHTGVALERTSIVRVVTSQLPPPRWSNGVVFVDLEKLDRINRGLNSNLRYLDTWFMKQADAKVHQCLYPFLAMQYIGTRTYIGLSKHATIYNVSPRFIRNANKITSYNSEMCDGRTYAVCTRAEFQLLELGAVFMQSVCIPPGCHFVSTSSHLQDGEM
jgi:hypothetical protein